MSPSWRRCPMTTSFFVTTPVIGAYSVRVFFGRPVCSSRSISASGMSHSLSRCRAAQRLPRAEREQELLLHRQELGAVDREERLARLHELADVIDVDLLREPR